MRFRHVGIVLAAAAVIFGAWWLRGRGGEDRVRRNLQRIVESAATSGSEPELAALARARRISELFTEDCRAAHAEEGAVAEGRADIARHVAWARASVGEARFEAADLQVGTSASGEITTDFVLRVHRARGESELDGTAVTLTWIESGGDWKIDRAFLE